MAGDNAFGPLDENLATLVANGRPTNVLVRLILAVGALQESLKEKNKFSFTSKEFITGLHRENCEGREAYLVVRIYNKMSIPSS